MQHCCIYCINFISLKNLKRQSQQTGFIFQVLCCIIKSQNIMAKPVTLLTGFLGAGKTTLLNSILKAKPEVRFAIIENEFGEEGIDGELVMRAEDDIIEMNNGCLCCTLNDNLFEILNELHERQDSFDELIIETTGIADPAGVVSPFYDYPEIRAAFPVKRVICLADAQLIEDQLEETEEAIRQIAFSDIILINKTDKVDPDYLPRLEQLLTGINPFAKVFTGHQNSLPVESIFGTERDQDFKSGKTTCSHGHEHGSCPHPHHEEEKHHHRHGDIVSLSFRFSEPFDDKELHYRLLGFLVFQARGVYRVKGIINAAGVNHRLIVQSVGQSLSITGGAPWGEKEERTSRMVFIGKLLKPEGFEQLLKSCLARATAEEKLP